MFKSLTYFFLIMQKCSIPRDLNSFFPLIDGIPTRTENIALLYFDIYLRYLSNLVQSQLTCSDVGNYELYFERTITVLHDDCRVSMQSAM